jgi:hypothetical protein
VMFARESDKSKHHNSLGRVRKLATSYLTASGKRCC